MHYHDLLLTGESDDGVGHGDQERRDVISLTGLHTQTIELEERVGMLAKRE